MKAETRGALNMISWIRRYSCQDEPWAKQLRADYIKIGGIGALTKGFQRSWPKISNFSRNIFLAYIYLNHENSGDEPIFGNKKFIPTQWYETSLGKKQGIRRISDFFDSDGRLVPPDEKEDLSPGEKLEWHAAVKSIRKAGILIRYGTNRCWLDLEHLPIRTKDNEHLELTDCTNKALQFLLDQNVD